VETSARNTRNSVFSGNERPVILTGKLTGNKCITWHSPGGALVITT